MSDFPWFRMYNETLNDPKLKRIATVTKQPKALINGVWAGLLCLASESPDRGKLLISDDMPYLLEEIVEAVGVDFELGELIIDYLVRLNLVFVEADVYHITQWEQRQPKSDSSTERVRRYRQRQAAKKSDDMNGGGDGHYPKRDSNVSCNVTETESNVIESDKDIDKESPTTTTRTHAGDDDQFGQVVALLNQRGLYLDGFTSQLVQECYDDINPQGDETKLDWFRYACEESAGKRPEWRYMDKIIRGVGDSGSLSAHKANWESKRKDRNGQRNANSRKRTTTPAKAKVRNPYIDNGQRVSAAGLPIDPELLARSQQQPRPN